MFGQILNRVTNQVMALSQKSLLVYYLLQIRFVGLRDVKA